MVTTPTLLGGSFPRQQIGRPHCARRDDRAGGDNSVAGTVLVQMSSLVLEVTATAAPAGAWSHVTPGSWSHAGRWSWLAPVTLPLSASGCSASVLAAGKCLLPKALANS